MCSSIGATKTINFPFVPNGKLMILCAPVFKHISVDTVSVPVYRIIVDIESKREKRCTC